MREVLADELKQYIIDNNKTIDILEKLGCYSIKEYNKDYRAGLLEYCSKNAISITKDTLSVRVFKSNSQKLRGDIFSLCMDIKNILFPKAVKLVHEYLGLKYTYKKTKDKNKEFEDPLDIFKKVKKRSFVCNKEDLDIYNEHELDEYIPYVHIDWVRESIMPWTAEKFKIGYAPNRKRIIIPERYWCGDENDYIGIMGRTVIKEWDLLDIPKYLPIKAFPKSMNLYGLQENYKSIQERGIVRVYESQKSVLKRHSRGDETGVSLGCHDISDEQVRILISLNVPIDIIMDKGIDKNHVRSLCDRFYGIRNISYVWDEYDLLKDKESPADATNKIFDYLLKYKVNYDESERRQYIRWREKAKNI